MIRQYIARDNHRTWDERLPALLFVYNTPIHDSTAYSPTFLNFRRKLTLPGVMIGGDGLSPTRRLQRMREAYEYVITTAGRAFDHQRRNHDLRRSAQGVIVEQQTRNLPPTSGRGQRRLSVGAH